MTRETTFETLDETLGVLAGARRSWLDASLQERIELLRETRRTTNKVAERWVDASCAAKGIERGSRTEGEEWQAGPWLVIRCLRLFEKSLRDLAEGRQPRLPNVRSRRGTPAHARVFPTGGWDKLLFTGFSGDVVMEDGMSPEDVVARQAPAYRVAPDPSTTLVLGAGNVSSIGPTDALSKMFAERSTVLLKMNPVVDYLGPIIEEAFAPLIEQKIFRLCYGGAEVGEYLTAHELVDKLHLTGSDKTYEAILFGTDDDAADRKARNEPVLTKPFTAEVGSVTPVIVVPGPWRDRDFEYQGMHLASTLVNNGGFNCIASRVIVTHKDWEGRSRLMNSFRAALGTVRSRVAYYPGARNRHARFVEDRPDAERFGILDEERLPWTLITDVPESDPNNLCFTTEAFSSVVSEVGLDALDPVDFVQKAVAFANDTIWGSLGVTILVHPRSNRRTKKAVRKAVEDLQYGTVAVNQWSALGFAFMSAPWGGYPDENLSSGAGFVHNTYMLDGIVKTVCKGPWRVRPPAPWFPDTKTSRQTLRAVCRFEAKPSILRYIRAAFHSVRG